MRVAVSGVTLLLATALPAVSAEPVTGKLVQPVAFR